MANTNSRKRVAVYIGRFQPLPSLNKSLHFMQKTYDKIPPLHLQNYT